MKACILAGSSSLAEQTPCQKESLKSDGMQATLACVHTTVFDSLCDTLGLTTGPTEVQRAGNLMGAPSVVHILLALDFGTRLNFCFWKVVLTSTSLAPTVYAKIPQHFLHPYLVKHFGRFNPTYGDQQAETNLRCQNQLFSRDSESLVIRFDSLETLQMRSRRLRLGCNRCKKST
ncbi:hypothetical protein B0H14DRAFT_2591987 [Mycena olivaceomarginata]|nr:hypothetical protein B0H14DRAFT_2591987 [Mycena olivaceomarginata]